MRLSKAKLIKLLKPRLESLRYVEFKDSRSGFQGLFVKKVNTDFYLSLGLTIHRYYDSAFTGDFYLSKNTIIGATWGDIPGDSYKRPGFLLTKDERSIYYKDEINVEGSYNIWWDGNNADSIDDFLKVIETTEPRFINQIDLFNKIEHSKEIAILSNHAKAVKNIIATNKIEGSYSFYLSKK